MKKKNQDEQKSAILELKKKTVKLVKEPQEKVLAHLET